MGKPSTSPDFATAVVCQQIRSAERGFPSRHPGNPSTWAAPMGRCHAAPLPRPLVRRSTAGVFVS